MRVRGGCHKRAPPFSFTCDAFTALKEFLVNDCCTCGELVDLRLQPDFRCGGCNRLVHGVRGPQGQQLGACPGDCARGCARGTCFGMFGERCRTEHRCEDHQEQHARGHFLTRDSQGPGPQDGGPSGVPRARYAQIHPQGLVKTFVKICKAAVDKKSLPTHPVAAVAAGDVGVSRAAEHGPGGRWVLVPQAAEQCEVEEAAKAYGHFCREHPAVDFGVAEDVERTV